MTTQPKQPPAVKSPGALFLTEQAAQQAYRVAHDITATDAEHEAAIETLTLLALENLLPKRSVSA